MGSLLVTHAPKGWGSGIYASWSMYLESRLGKDTASGVVGRTPSTLGTPLVHSNCFNDLEYKTKFTIISMNYVALYKSSQ